MSHHCEVKGKVKEHTNLTLEISHFDVSCFHQQKVQNMYNTSCITMVIVILQAPWFYIIQILTAHEGDG